MKGAETVNDGKLKVPSFSDDGFGGLWSPMSAARCLKSMREMMYRISNVDRFCGENGRWYAFDRANALSADRCAIIMSCQKSHTDKVHSICR